MLPHKVQNGSAEPLDDIGRRKRQSQQQQKNGNRVFCYKYKILKQRRIKEHMDKPNVCGMLAEIAQRARQPFWERTDAKEHNCHRRCDKRDKKRRYYAMHDDHSGKNDCRAYIYIYIYNEA